MIYRYIRNTTKTRSIPELLYFNTQCGSCDEENANLFNEFFYSVFTQSSIDPNNIDDLTSDVLTPLTELDFTQYEVYNILASLDVTKATGILKNCALLLCFPLHLLFKKCLKQCVIPTEWATHIIIPVFKSGEKNLVNNYRPISLLCNVSKVLEELVYDKIINFLSESIPLVQFGALRGMSTLQQLLIFLNFVHNNHNQQIDVI